MNAPPLLSGRLASLGLVPLARFLASLGKSGDLIVAHDAWRARLCFDRGRLTAAVAPSEVGWPAVEFALLGLAAGDFEFRAGRPSLQPNLELTGEAADEAQLWARLEHLAVAAAGGGVPGPTAVPRLTRVSGDGEQAVVDLDRASLAVLLAVDGRADVRALAARLGGLRALRGLARLHSLDLLTFTTPATASTASAVREPPAADPPTDSAAGQPSDPTAQPKPRHVPPRRRLLRRLRSLPVAFGLLGLSLAAAPQALVAVDGTSMLPSLRSGQLLFVNRAAYVVAAPRRGEVVVFRHTGPGFADEYVVKRVIGLPGDLVQVDTGQVFVNGVRLDEPYVADPDDYTYPQGGGPLRVPEGAYFVLGDNRPFSADSHLGWFVSSQELVGQAWPLPAAVPARVPLNS